ncbi:hypothetical protein AnigIFM63326_011282 [Aspergillus niger]|nr:hypothetical protein AnigIFM63326_011282 [Aspergillus niger]
MTTLWEVINFKVQTSAQNNTSDSIFANGQMQAKVIVTIRAIDASTGANYQLTKAELEGIKLINYYSKNELKGNWFYSTTENDFAHTLPRAGDPVEPIADGTQSISFWVSSTQIGNENIAAQISQPGAVQSTVITTTGGSFESMVTLEAIQPITYTQSNVTFTREDTAQGTWKRTSASGTSTYGWDQDNYYLSSDFYPFLKVNRHGVDTTGKENGIGSTAEMQDSFAFLRVDSTDISIFYMFDMGTAKTVTRGLSTYSFTASYFRTADIKINQRPNALCLTRLRFINGHVSLSNWNAGAWFTIYDLYGNYGHFTVNINSQNTMSISSRNIRSPVESDSIERAAKI